MPSVEELGRDLAAEQAAVDGVLEGLEPADWHRPTPAAGWDVLDSLAHLCFFEEAAALAVRDPAAFGRHREELLEAMSGSAAATQVRPDVIEARRGTAPSELLERWRRARSEFLAAVGGAGRPDRIPWYGPAMGPASFVTARILEAFAHGTDIRDGLGVPLEATGRLRHVCHLAFGSRPFCFATHRIPDPGTPVRFEIAGPGGQPWTWGPVDATEVIAGPALDVALVFVQRRHPDRTAVTAEGPTARLWLSIAQAFAGPATRVAPDR